MPTITPPEIIIVGGGIAGLSAAWWLQEKGFGIRVIEKQECGMATSRIAAGMLAPVHELEFTELEILKAGLESLEIYNHWESELGDIGLNRTGTIEVASSAEDIPYLKRQFEFQREQGQSVFWLDQRSLIEKEPMLAGTVPCGIFAPGDIQVENRILLPKLREALLRRGGVINEFTEFVSWDESNSIALIKDNKGDEEKIPAQCIVLATGVASGLVPNHPEIIPVKGEMIALEPNSSFPLKHVIRIRNRRLGNAYVVPKRFTILAGSSSEHKGYDTSNTLGGVMDIMRKCYQVLPGLYELKIQEIYAGLRPASLDHLPKISTILPGSVYCLNGLYRHGILLGPWAGRELAEMIHSQK